MQTQKMSLDNIQGKLSRTEMKNIIAGTCRTSCSCNGSVGSWTYGSTGPIAIATLRRDVGTYCSSGSGTCTCAQT
jgi:hypothetical protein